MVDVAHIGGSWRASGQDFATLEQALGAPDITPLMPSSVTRWISASVAGMPRVTPEVLAALAADVSTRAIRRPVDGGSADSPPHATAERSDALANGWVHAARVIQRDEGTHELMLFAELLPDVAASFDAGRLAYASIYAEATSDGVGSMLHSLALTNLPLDPNVTAATVARARKSPPAVTQAANARAVPAEGTHMEPTQAAPAAKPVVAAESSDPMATMQAQIDELKKMVEQLMSEKAAIAAALESTTKELVNARAATGAETPESLFENAVREGRLTRADSAVFVEFARKSPELFKSIVASRPALTGRIVSPRQSDELAARDPLANDVDAEAIAIINSRPISDAAKKKAIARLKAGV